MESFAAMKLTPKIQQLYDGALNSPNLIHLHVDHAALLIESNAFDQSMKPIQVNDGQLIQIHHSADQMSICNNTKRLLKSHNTNQL